MTRDQFSERLSRISNGLRAELVDLISTAQKEQGLDTNTNKPLSFNDDPNIEYLIDDIVCMGGWVSDRMNGINRLHRKSLTKKLRKALGFTAP